MWKKLIIIFVTVLILASCATAPKPGSDREKLLLLNQELHRWQSFKMTGLADVQYQSFSFRRESVIALSEGKFRFDVLDSGFFGLGSGVFLSAFVDNAGIQFRKPGTTRVESILPDTKTEQLLSFLTEKWSDLLSGVKDNIISTNQAELYGITLVFTDRMRLSEISNKDENLKITFVYDTKENLTEINISIPLVRKLTIQVDKIEYENIIVTPLIKP